MLVDTSVWVDHFRASDDRLGRLLLNNEVSIHPWIIGELACGNLKERAKVLPLLEALPVATSSSERTVRDLIERQSLMGLGIGWIDVNLLASSLVSGHPLWTRDRRLATVAKRLSTSFD